MTQVIAVAEIHTNFHRQMAATGIFDDQGNPQMRVVSTIEAPGDVFEWEGENAEMESLIKSGHLELPTREALAFHELVKQRGLAS